MNLIITLTSAGINSGPFNLYSDVDGYAEPPFETDVPKQDLLDGYVSTLVPDGTIVIRVQSDNDLCTNYIDLYTSGTTTTTTSSTSTSTTTSTTTVNPCTNCTIDNIVTIGTQIWTSCNLETSTYANGDVIPEVTDPAAWEALTTGAWCYYNNDASNGCIYGKLYNWYAVVDPRGLAPAGYHIPSKVELQTLTSYLGSNAGGKMKESGTAHWNSPNLDATNTSSFTAFGGGYRADYGDFINLRRQGVWWSTTQGATPFVAWDVNLDYYSGNAIIGNGVKKGGFSVRLIQD